MSNLITSTCYTKLFPDKMLKIIHRIWWLYLGKKVTNEQNACGQIPLPHFPLLVWIGLKTSVYLNTKQRTLTTPSAYLSFFSKWSTIINGQVNHQMILWNKATLPGTGSVFFTKKVGVGGPDPMHTNSALAFSLTLTAIEGGPKEDADGIAM